MMNSTGKSLIPLLVLTGLVLVVAFILYQAGFRVATTATPTAEPRQNHQPGQHHRRQEMAAGQSDSQQNGGGDQGGRAARRGGEGSKRQAEIRVNTLGAKKIAVIGKGKEQSFTGADLEKLQQITIASNRGLRAGWRLADVLNQLTIAQGNEVVLTAEDGKTLSLPWEKVTSREPTLLLTYNSFGGLMLVSGKEVTKEEIQAMDNRAVKTGAKENREQSTFISQIKKIEVKG
jgi:hypothetical protein